MVKRKNYILVITMIIFLLGVSIWCILHGNEDYSMSERRYLKQFPVLTWDTVTSGKFMSDFESYTQDQFPARDAFRGLKSVASQFVFGQKDNNDLYLAGGHIGKLEYPYDEASVIHAADVFRNIYDKYLLGTDCKVYYSVIPDKGYFLAEENGYLSMDYAALENTLCNNMQEMEYINLFDVMEAEDFYNTDTHWRQEEIQDVAETLLVSMGGTADAQYEVCKTQEPFYGVYYGQMALPLEADNLYYLDNEELQNCIVYDYTSQTNIPVYNMDKITGPDAYEMFLSGSLSLVTIENPTADSDKELILFRDSFGSSIAPLLVEEYGKITLVDIRYLSSNMLVNYIDFEEQDVLFLYSTLVLNNSETLK